MIYQIKDLDTGVWDTNHFASTEAAADYANDLIKRAVIRREKGIWLSWVGIRRTSNT